MGRFLGMGSSISCRPAEKTNAVHLVLCNYDIRDKVPAPPKRNELALSWSKLSGARVPQLSTEITIEKLGQRARLQVRKFPRNGTQLCVALATSLVLETAGSGCGVALQNDLHSCKVGA